MAVNNYLLSMMQVIKLKIGPSEPNTTPQTPIVGCKSPKKLKYAYRLNLNSKAKKLDINMDNQFINFNDEDYFKNTYTNH